MDSEFIVKEFLELSPYDICKSDALKDFLEKHEYIAFGEENIFELAMKLIYETYR